MKQTTVAASHSYVNSATQMQHKQDLVKAIKAQQYSTAASILEKALTVAPGDALLLEFQAAVQAKLKLDEDASSSDGDDDGSECSHGSGSAGSFGTDEQEQEDDSEGADEGPSGSGSDAGDDGDLSSAGPASSTSAVTAGATVDGKSGQGGAVEQTLQHTNQPEGCAEVSSITLAASSSTLTPQRRLELRQQLAASISWQKDEMVRQQLLKSDPLLAAL